MNQHNPWQPWLWVFLIILLTTAVYVSWQFITQLEQGAEGINSQVAQVKEMPNVNTFTLSQASESHLPSPEWYTQETVSRGVDLTVQKGEFGYRDGQPFVKVALYNQGSFTITAAKVSVSLFLDDATSATAESVAVDVPFDGVILASGDSMVVDIPVSGEMWTDDMVRWAEKRRVLVQVVTVSDGDRDNVDYPQTDVGAWLKQVQNDWGQLPNIPTENPEEMVYEEHNEPTVGENPLNNPVVTTPANVGESQESF